MNHYRWDEVTHEEVNPLFARRVIHGERLTVARVYLKKGCRVPLHSHDHEQITNVLVGRVRFQIGSQEKIVGADELVHVPPASPHSVEALEDSLCLDIFNPIREDWLRGEDSYLRR